MHIHAPSERNPKLARFLAAAQRRHASSRPAGTPRQVNAERLGMSDHSWVHLQIVLNRALRLYRLLRRGRAVVDRDRLRRSSRATPRW